MEREQRLAHLDSIRAIAVFMVVGIHAMTYMPLEGAERAIVGFLVHTVAVPIFFLVDGIIFAIHARDGRPLNYPEYILKSAQRLLIPWFIFSLLYVFMRWVFEYFGFFSDRIVVGTSLWDILKLIYSSQVSNQMYFLLSLFFIRIFSFLWYRLSLLRQCVLLGVWVCYTAISSLWGAQLAHVFANGLDPVVHAVMGLRFFLFGTVVFACQSFMKKYSVPILLVSLVTVVIFKAFFPGTFLVQLPYMTCVYVLFLKFFENDNLLSHIGRYTMGIYLIHAPVVLKAASMAFQKLNVEGLFGYIAVLCTAFLISLGLARLIGSVKIGRLILGERT